MGRKNNNNKTEILYPPCVVIDSPYYTIQVYRTKSIITIDYYTFFLYSNRLALVVESIFLLLLLYLLREWSLHRMDRRFVDSDRRLSNPTYEQSTELLRCYISEWFLKCLITLFCWEKTNFVYGNVVRGYGNLRIHVF